MVNATIWAQPTSATTMERLGSGRNSHIIPEGISYTWDLGGPKSASFSLRRPPGVPWPDLGAMAPIDIDVNGTRVWSGRLSEAPQQTGDANVINVTCEGWQAHLEDRLIVKLYVHTTLADWVDMRTVTAIGGEGANALGTWTSAYQYNTAPLGGAISMALPSAATTVGNTAVSAFLALAPGLTAQRAVVTWQSSTWAATAAALLPLGGVGTLSLGSNPLVVAGPTTSAITFSTPTGTFEVRVQNQTGAAVTGTDATWFKLTAIAMFGSTAWESGNVSILKASDVIKDLIPKAPLLNQTDFSQITASSFSIPQAYFPNPQTPGEIARAVNTYHDWLLGVDQYRRVFFQAKSTVPVISVGQWSNAQFQDTSAGTSADVYNEAVLTSTAPDGTPLLVTRTAASTLLTAQGLTKTKSIPISGPSTTAALQQLGDVFLTANSKQPFKGSFSGQGFGAFRTVTNATPYPAYLVPTLVGQLLRIDHWIDPDSGGLGRLGRIAEATYTVDDDTVSLSLDNTRSNFQAFMARVATLTGAALGTS